LRPERLEPGTYHKYFLQQHALAQLQVACRGNGQCRCGVAPCGLQCNKSWESPKLGLTGTDGQNPKVSAFDAKPSRFQRRGIKSHFLCPRLPKISPGNFSSAASLPLASPHHHSHPSSVTQSRWSFYFAILFSIESPLGLHIPFFALYEK